MSEFSIEEKANAYDVALNKAKTLLSKCKCDRDRTTMIYRAEDIESIFPELKEFSDEEIKKWLIGYFQEYKSIGIIEEFGNGLKVTDVISWLEKQSKQSSNILWHDVSEEPDEQREIFCEWKGYADNIWHDVAFYHPSNKTFWNGEDQIENVVKWAYIDEMLEEQPQSQIKPKFKAGDTIQCVSDETDKRTIASSICTGICETCTLNPCPNWEDINCAVAGR